MWVTRWVTGDLGKGFTMLSLPFRIYADVVPKAASEGGCEDSAGPCVVGSAGGDQVWPRAESYQRGTHP